MSPEDYLAWLARIDALISIEERCANLSQCLAAAGMLEEAYRRGKSDGWVKGLNWCLGNRTLAWQLKNY